MSEEKKTVEIQPIYPATVVYVAESFRPDRLVVNRGSAHGVKAGQRFMVYAVSNDEIIDPDTKESLGKLEVVRGTGKAEHVQEKMATLRSDMKGAPVRTVKRIQNPLFIGSTSTEETYEESDVVRPFDGPQVGDRARPIA